MMWRHGLRWERPGTCLTAVQVCRALTCIQGQNMQYIVQQLYCLICAGAYP
jgi:hypothetical protein